MYRQLLLSLTVLGIYSEFRYLNSNKGSARLIFSKRIFYKYLLKLTESLINFNYLGLLCNFLRGTSQTTEGCSSWPRIFPSFLWLLKECKQLIHTVSSSQIAESSLIPPIAPEDSESSRMPLRALKGQIVFAFSDKIFNIYGTERSAFTEKQVALLSALFSAWVLFVF